ncbi:MAG: hypothetical protein ABI717_08765, partial [Actinomycetota bacterium]
MWTALGSSSVYPWNIPVGRTMRWVVLAELAAFALLYVWLRPRRDVRVSAWVVLAAALPALAVLSALWSPVPGLTAGRALTVAALFVAAGAVTYGVGASPERRGEILLGILAGCVVVAVFG